MTNMRRGFTMIELIFVIVIIGILAAVAIPKLAATRDDAKATKAVANVRTCINDVGAAYTARGAMDTSTASCQAVTSDACFSLGTTTDGNLTVSNASNSDKWCEEAQRIAGKQDLNGTHEFGGSHIVQ